MAKFYFPTNGKVQDVPESDFQFVNDNFGALKLNDDDTLPFNFPSTGKTQNVPVADFEFVKQHFGATPAGGIVKAPADESAELGVTEATIDPTKALKEAARPGYTWIGRQMTDDQIMQINGGGDYLKLRDKLNAGKKGFVESITPWVEDIPFAGSAIGAIDTGKLVLAARKMNSGEELTDDELVSLNSFLINEQRNADASWGGKLGSIILGSATFGVEMAAVVGATLLTLPELGAGGIALAGSEAAKKLAWNRARAAVKDAVTKFVSKQFGPEAVKKGLGKATIKGAGALAYAGTAGGINTVVQQGVDGIASVTMGEGFQSKEGNVRNIYKSLNGEDETMLKSYAMGTLQNMIENASEFTGGYAMKGLGKMAGLVHLDKIGAKLRSNIDIAAANVFRGVNEKVAKGKAAEIARKIGLGTVFGKVMDRFNKDPREALEWMRMVGYDGIAEEFAEERIGGFLHGMFGTQGDETGLRNAFKESLPDSWGDAAAELVAFAVPIGTATGMRKLRNYALGKVDSVIGATQAFQELTAPRMMRLKDEAGNLTDEYVAASIETEVDRQKVSDAAKLVDVISEMNPNDKRSLPGKLVEFGFDLLNTLQTGDVGQLMMGSTEMSKTLLGKLAIQKNAVRDAFVAEGMELGEANKAALRVTEEALLRQFKGVVHADQKDSPLYEKMLELESRGFIRNSASSRAYLTIAGMNIASDEMQKTLNRMGVPMQMTVEQNKKLEDGTIESSKITGDTVAGATANTQTFYNAAEINDWLNETNPDNLTLEQQMIESIRRPYYVEIPGADGKRRVVNLADPFRGKGSLRFYKMRNKAIYEAVKHYSSNTPAVGRLLYDSQEKRNILITGQSENGSQFIVGKNGQYVKASEIGADQRYQVAPLKMLQMSPHTIIDTETNIKEFAASRGYDASKAEKVPDASSKTGYRVDEKGNPLYMLQVNGVNNAEGTSLAFDPTKDSLHSIEEIYESINKQLGPQNNATLGVIIDAVGASVAQKLKDQRAAGKDAVDARLVTLEKLLKTEEGRFEIGFKLLANKLLKYDNANYSLFSSGPIELADEFEALSEGLTEELGPGAEGLMQTALENVLGTGAVARYINPFSQMESIEVAELLSSLTGQKIAVDQVKAQKDAAGKQKAVEVKTEGKNAVESEQESIARLKAEREAEQKLNDEKKQETELSAAAAKKAEEDKKAEAEAAGKAAKAEDEALLKKADLEGLKALTAEEKVKVKALRQERADAELLAKAARIDSGNPRNERLGPKQQERLVELRRAEQEKLAAETAQQEQKVGAETVIPADMYNSVGVIEAPRTGADVLRLEKGYAYRTITQAELDHLRQVGYLVPNPALAGKKKKSRGQTRQKMWSKQNEAKPEAGYGYSEGTIILRTKLENLKLEDAESGLGARGHAVAAGDIEVIEARDGNWVTSPAIRQTPAQQNKTLANREALKQNVAEKAEKAAEVEGVKGLVAEQKAAKASEVKSVQDVLAEQLKLEAQFGNAAVGGQVSKDQRKNLASFLTGKLPRKPGDTGPKNSLSFGLSAQQRYMLDMQNLDVLHRFYVDVYRAKTSLPEDFYEKLSAEEQAQFNEGLLEFLRKDMQISDERLAEWGAYLAEGEKPASEEGAEDNIEEPDTDSDEATQKDTGINYEKRAEQMYMGQEAHQVLHKMLGYLKGKGLGFAVLDRYFEKVEAQSYATLDALAAIPEAERNMSNAQVQAMRLDPMVWNEQAFQDWKSSPASDNDEAILKKLFGYYSYPAAKTAYRFYRSIVRVPAYSAELDEKGKLSWRLSNEARLDVTQAERVLGTPKSTLLDAVDNADNRGVEKLKTQLDKIAARGLSVGGQVMRYLNTNPSAKGLPEDLARLWAEFASELTGYDVNMLKQMALTKPALQASSEWVVYTMAEHDFTYFDEILSQKIKKGITEAVAAGRTFDETKALAVQSLTAYFTRRRRKGKVPSGMESLAQQTGRVLASTYLTPGTNERKMTRQFISPLIQQYRHEMYKLRQFAGDIRSPLQEALLGSELIVFSGVMGDGRTGKRADASDMSAAEQYELFLQLYKESHGRTVFLDFISGEKRNVMGLMLTVPQALRDKYAGETNIELRYHKIVSELRQLIDPVLQGSYSDWKKGNAVEYNKRGAVYNTQGLRYLHVEGGLPILVKTAVYDDVGKEGDGASHQTEQAAKESAEATAADNPNKICYKTTETGLMFDGKPFLSKGNISTLSDAAAEAGGSKSIIARIKATVDAYNATHAADPLRMMISSETIKSGLDAAFKNKLGAEGELKTINVPLSMFIEQQNLDSTTKPHKVRIAIQLISDLQSAPDGAKFLSILNDAMAYENGKLIEQGLPPLSDTLADRASFISRLLKQGVDPKNPFIAALADQLQVSQIFRMLTPRMMGTHGVALPASGSNLADSSADKGKSNRYIPGEVIAEIAGARYAEEWEAAVVEEVLKGIAQAANKGILLDMMIRDPKTGKYQRSGADGKTFTMADVRAWELKKSAKGWIVPGQLVILNRTPGTGFESHILGRLGAKPKKGFGNGIMLNQNTVARAGVDFDGDKWHIYTLESDKDGMVGQYQKEVPESFKYATNEMILGVLDSYDNITMSAKGDMGVLHAKIDTEFFKTPSNFTDEDLRNRATRLQSILETSQKAKGGLNIAQPLDKLQLQEMAWVVRNAIGPFAASITTAQLTLPSGMASFPNKIQLTDELVFDRTAANNSAESDAYMRPLEGIITNMIIDNAKYLYMDALGVTDNNVALLFMALMGSGKLTSREDAIRRVYQAFDWMRSAQMTVWSLAETQLARTDVKDSGDYGISAAMSPEFQKRLTAAIESSPTLTAEMKKSILARIKGGDYIEHLSDVSGAYIGDLEAKPEHKMAYQVSVALLGDKFVPQIDAIEQMQIANNNFRRLSQIVRLSGKKDNQLLPLINSVQLMRGLYTSDTLDGTGTIRSRKEDPAHIVIQHPRTQPALKSTETKLTAVRRHIYNQQHPFSHLFDVARPKRDWNSQDLYAGEALRALAPAKDDGSATYIPEFSVNVVTDKGQAKGFQALLARIVTELKANEKYATIPAIEALVIEPQRGIMSAYRNQEDELTDSLLERIQTSFRELPESLDDVQSARSSNGKVITRDTLMRMLLAYSIIKHDLVAAPRKRNFAYHMPVEAFKLMDQLVGAMRTAEAAGREKAREEAAKQKADAAAKAAKVTAKKGPTPQKPVEKPVPQKPVEKPAPQKPVEKPAKVERKAPTVLLAKDNPKAAGGPLSQPNTLSTMRIISDKVEKSAIGLELDRKHNFSSPFILPGMTADVQLGTTYPVAAKGFDALLSQYDAWLRGNGFVYGKDKNVSKAMHEQRNWIISKIENGQLDGVTLVDSATYVEGNTTKTKVDGKSVAHVLAKFVVDHKPRRTVANSLSLRGPKTPPLSWGNVLARGAFMGVVDHFDIEKIPLRDPETNELVLDAQGLPVTRYPKLTATQQSVLKQLNAPDGWAKYMRRLAQIPETHHGEKLRYVEQKMPKEDAVKINNYLVRIKTDALRDRLSKLILQDAGLDPQQIAEAELMPANARVAQQTALRFVDQANAHFADMYDPRDAYDAGGAHTPNPGENRGGAAEAANRAATMSLSTRGLAPLIEDLDIFGLYSKGTAVLHEALIGETNKANALRTMTVHYYNEVFRRFGLNGEIYSMDPTILGRPVDTMTDEEKESVERFFAAITSITCHERDPQAKLTWPKKYKSVRDIILDEELTDEKKQEMIIEGFSEIFVAWADEFNPKVAAGERSDVENVANVLNDWLKSSAKAKLVKAGRSEASLHWFKYVNDSVRYYAAMEKEFPYLHHTGRTVPLLFGWGFESRETRTAKDAIDRELKNVTNNVASGETLLTEAEYQRDFTKAEAPKPTRIQIELYMKLTTNKASSELPADLAAKTTMWDLNAMIAKQLYIKLLTGAIEKGAQFNFEDPVVRKQLMTLKKINMLLHSYKFKEWTNFEEELPISSGDYTKLYIHTRNARIAVQADRRAYREELLATKYAGMDIVSEEQLELDLNERYPLPRVLRPMTLNFLKLRMTHSGQSVNANMHRALVRKMVLTPDMDGRPLVIAVPSSFMGTRPLLSDSIYEAMIQQWGLFAGKKIDTSDPAKYRGIIEHLASSYASSEEYETVESPFPSIAKFLVRKGDAHRVLLHLVEAPWRWEVAGVDIPEMIQRTVQWTKLQSVGWSLFFPFSLMESVLAGTGLANNYLWTQTDAGGKIQRTIPFFGAFKNTQEIIDYSRKLTSGSDPMLSEEIYLMTLAGIQLGMEAAADEHIGVVAQDIERMAEAARLRFGEKAAASVRNLFEILSGSPLSKRFFGEAGKHGGLFPAMKVWAINRAAMEAAQANGVDWLTISKEDKLKLYKELANPINDAYGGQLWQRYLWATPRVRQFMSFGMFAPNWTLSALNIAGGGVLTGRFLGNTMDQANRAFVIKNLLAMAGVVLFAIPNAIQAAIYLAAGSGDDDDHPFTFQNEEGRKTYVDVTPLARLLPWYDGDPTGKRRVYVRFGKQAYEVYEGWMTEAPSQFMRKLSQPVKLIIEEATGKSPGSDWNLEFQGQGLRGLFLTDADGVQSFLSSRVGYAVQKVLPMSISTFIKSPEMGVAAFIAPISKGMSAGKATQALIEVFTEYADNDHWDKYRKTPGAVARLDQIAPGIIDALERNGYDTEKVIKTAKGVVLSGLYKQFFAAMESRNSSRLNSLAESIIRVGGTAEGLRKSISQRKKQYKQDVTPEDVGIIQGAFGMAEQ